MDAALYEYILSITWLILPREWTARHHWSWHSLSATEEIAHRPMSILCIASSYKEYAVWRPRRPNGGGLNECKIHQGMRKSIQPHHKAPRLPRNPLLRVLIIVHMDFEYLPNRYGQKKIVQLACGIRHLGHSDADFWDSCNVCL